MKFDVLGLSETRQLGKKLIKKSNGDICYLFGKTEGFSGVGFIMRKRWANKVTELEGISERIAIAKFKINKKAKLAIFQVYAPTTAAPKEERKLFYRTLKECYEREQERYTIIMGDFNCKLAMTKKLKDAQAHTRWGLLTKVVLNWENSVNN